MLYSEFQFLHLHLLFHGYIFLYKLIYLCYLNFKYIFLHKNPPIFIIPADFNSILSDTHIFCDIDHIKLIYNYLFHKKVKIQFFGLFNSKP